MKKRSSCQQIQKRTVKTRRTHESVTIGMDLGDRTSRYCMLVAKVRSCGKTRFRLLKLG